LNEALYGSLGESNIPVQQSNDSETWLALLKWYDGFSGPDIILVHTLYFHSYFHHSCFTQASLADRGMFHWNLLWENNLSAGFQLPR